jgi:regulator of replication initiation timing
MGMEKRTLSENMGMEIERKTLKRRLGDKKYDELLEEGKASLMFGKPFADYSQDDLIVALGLLQRNHKREQARR